MQYTSGGVCAAKGFRASGIHCGLRKKKDIKDLALIISDAPANAAGVYTQNLVKGAPLLVSRDHLSGGVAQAIVCNSGNANTCNANGEAIARQMCEIVSEHTGIPAQHVVVASTGVIGKPLPIEPIAQGMPSLVSALSDTGSADAASAIMTTDLRKKEIAVTFELGGNTCHIGGIAKGSGMIHPNMATMLGFLTTDVAISSEMLSRALGADIQDTFNMVSVDGDTSTNDMVVVLANGLSGNAPIVEENADYAIFAAALRMVTEPLSKAIAQDGEGATKLLTCEVEGAQTVEDARAIAKSVICSSLVKTAMFGADANWGRVLCAIGYAGVPVDIGAVDVSFVSSAGSVDVCANGAGIDFSEEIAKAVLSADAVTIRVALHAGAEKATAWGCDLSYDYVKINGDYRT